MVNISVVIPAKNEEASIGACLDSLKKQRYKDFDIWIVNSMSTDKTAEVSKKYTSNILTIAAPAPGPARNAGVKKSQANIIAFIDADTLAPQDWLERIAADFKDNPDLVAVGGVLKPLNARLWDKIMFKINSDWWYRLTALIGFYQLGTPNCAYRRDIFLKEGGFNEEMSMLEDTELSLRISKHGPVMIDKNLYTFNSARRFRQEGYLTVFLRYLKAYYKMWTGKKVKAKHFDKITHD